MVVGGSRGIGLALTRAQLENHGVARVIATHRPGSDLKQLTLLSQEFGDRLHVQSLDTADDRSIAQFAAILEQQTGGIDVAIHCAGILHGDGLEPEKSVSQCRRETLLRSFETNSIGPLLIAGALLASQSRNRHFKYAALSAMVGSITDNRLGGWYGYRASKAALNQFLKTLSIECRIKYPNASIVAVHPGTTDTDLSRPFQGGVKPGKLYTPEQTAARILNVIESVDRNQSGQFLNWDGNEIPW